MCDEEEHWEGRFFVGVAWAAAFSILGWMVLAALVALVAALFG